MKLFLSKMQEVYDVARLVNASECFTLNLDDGDSIAYDNSCFCTWHRKERCINCSSYRAHISGIQQKKIELHNGKIHRVTSVPATLLLNDGTPCACVLELISVGNSFSEESEAEIEKTINANLLPSLNKDLLTGLLSKDEFYREVRKNIIASPETQRYIIYADIDDFKFINDLLGRMKGNQVLIQTAEYLSEMCGENGICARSNADKFLACVDKAQYSEEVLEYIAGKVAKILKSNSMTVQIRFGVYKIANSQITVSVMTDYARMALKQIKGDSIKRIAYYDEELMAQNKHEYAVLEAFDNTLKNNHFHIYLQAQVHASGKLQGAEVLVRWIDEKQGLIPPNDFIPILEKTGIISQLDKAVWEMAAATLKSWEGSEKEYLYLSINISAKDFYYLDVYETLTKIVEKYQIDAKKLRLEITESVLMSDVEKLLNITRKLHSAGFLIEIDDFGKGYSSLSMLKDIDVDVLKIDMEFLRETEHTEKSRIILSSIIEMSQKLGIDIITEGVESKAQMEHLQELGCYMYQGYYFAKPISVAEFEAKYFGE